MDATEKFVVGSYLTTYGSVWQEGIVLPDPPVFCRSYPVMESDVTEAVLAIFDEVLRPLGYEVMFDESRGLLQTDYVVQEHEMALWRDRFTVAIVALESHRTVVSVQRDVEIMRKHGSTRLAFYPGVSVGRNEAWILNAVGRRLGAE